jgi:hypothetical protein
MTEAPSEPTGSWHHEAREMRQSGATYTEIARKFSVSVPAAYFAVNPHKRHPTKRKLKAQLSAAPVGDNPAL